MKWFKHMSAAHTDDKLVVIREKFGMWGVGCYWTIVEMVAQQLKPNSDKPLAVFNVSVLCSFFECKRNKLFLFLKHLRNQTGMNIKQNGNIIEIEIPKLLEIKDNYLKDLEVSSKTLPSKEVEVEEEVDKKKSTQSMVHKFSGIWNVYPIPKGKKEALRHFKASVKTEEDFRNIEKALANYAESGNVKNGFIMNGSTWFNNWEDWIEPTEQMMKGNNYGQRSNSGKGNSQIERATFMHDEARIRRLKEFTESLRERDRQRSERP